jgi:hypothetical protein
MGLPYRDELLQVKNKTLAPYNVYNTDTAAGSASIACNVFEFGVGKTEYRNDRLIRMASVPVSQELYIQRLQVFSYRVSSGGAVSPLAGYAGNPADNQSLVDYLTLYVCQNVKYSVSGAGSLADPRRIAISSGLIANFTIRFNDAFYTPEFDFPYFLSANDTLSIFIDNAFPNPVTYAYNDFNFYTRISGVIGTKSQEH